MHIGRSAEAIEKDRQRYEEHQRKGLEFTPKTMPKPSPLPAMAITKEQAIHKEILPGGWYWSTVLNKGETLRISQGNAFSSVAMMAWYKDEPSERLNLADTAKLQWTTALTKGRVLFSDMGRVMLSITEDSSGCHDCLMGGSNALSNSQKYNSENHRNSRDNFILLAGKLGLTKRDLSGIMHLFAPLYVDEDSKIHWDKSKAIGNNYIELRAEMDVILGFSNCPHPLDQATHYAPADIILERFQSGVIESDDLCKTATAEAVRGFENNAAFEA